MQLHAGFISHKSGQRIVVIITAQGRITARGNHFKHALGQAQHGDIESAAAQVVHGVNTLRRVVQAIGNRRSRGLIDQAQQVDAGELGRILGRLTLGIVKVSGHGDDGAIQLIIKSVFGAKAQRGENFSADFHRRLSAVHGFDSDHTAAQAVCSKLVRQFLG